MPALWQERGKVNMHCKTFGQRNLVKRHNTAWLDLREKRMSKSEWGKAEWLADFDREMRSVDADADGDYKDLAAALYSAAADWVARNASVMPSEVRELFDDMPDGYNCPRAWMAWCPN